MAERPRILVLGTPPAGADGLAACRRDAEVIRVESIERALDRLRSEPFAAFVAEAADHALLETLRTLLQAQRILASVPDGVAVVDFDLRIRWANPTFTNWCGGNAVGRGFYEALGSPATSDPEYCPFHTALSLRDTRGKPPTVTTRLNCGGNRHIDLHVTPIHEGDGRQPLLIAIGRDVTKLVIQQQKLDALYKAGRELAPFTPEQLAEMSAEERIEILKQNIRRITRDLLHYDVIEIRVLDRRTGQLQLLLQDGMCAEAAGRVLTAATEGQGVTGFVAATGKSYLCPDTTADPLYIKGLSGAHSSLTVPLIYQDRVIGTFNVESPRPAAFGEEDLHFAELFSYEVADALHTLELLSAEKVSSASQSVDAVSREVALPVDEILTATTAILDRYIGHDAEMCERLRKILNGARAIKAVIQQVGNELAPGGWKPSDSVKQQPPPSLKGLRVLVADSDERVRRSAHSLLGRWGCIVETARDGKEALTMARLGTYDAILADIRLPDLTGYEAYRKLREAQPQARVILMTSYGYDPTHALVKARQDGLRSVLFKPFRVDQLLQALSSPDGAPAPLKPEPVTG
jgi:CheY-like chemotaxis protein/PAS domain-containing protein